MREPGPKALTDSDIREVRAFSSEKCYRKVLDAATVIDIIAKLCENPEATPENFKLCVTAILQDY